MGAHFLAQTALFPALGDPTIISKTTWAILIVVTGGLALSMANVGAAASAPVVAGVYHPAMAPVGLLMAVDGYILGIYGALVWPGSWASSAPDGAVTHAEGHGSAVFSGTRERLSVEVPVGDKTQEKLKKKVERKAGAKAAMDEFEKGREAAGAEAGATDERASAGKAAGARKKPPSRKAAGAEKKPPKKKAAGVPKKPAKKKAAGIPKKPAKKKAAGVPTKPPRKKAAGIPKKPAKNT